MNDEYQERGLFKELVLIAWCVFGWISEKIERLLKREVFWWSLSGFFLGLALACLFKIAFAK